MRLPRTLQTPSRLRGKLRVLGAVSALLFSGVSVSQAAPKAPPKPAAPLSPPPLFREYCYDCHGEGSKKGGIAFDQLPSKNPEEERKLWFAVWRNLESQLMPPSDKPRPSASEQAQMREWIESQALHLDPEQPDPGRVTIRRLNREEYRNTIRDLAGVEFPVEDRFPPDDTGYGFDTIGDVLNLSPIHLEKYLAAGQEVAALWAKSNAQNAKSLFPQGPPPPDPALRKEYVRGLLRPFVTRAFRRPVDDPTLEKLTQIASSDETFDEGMLRAMAVVLASPRFLFRAEIQTAADQTGASIPVDEFALASRLSYFLWSSMPDAELLKLASEGKLRSQWQTQVTRLLNDSKSERFARHFVGQWLQTRDTEFVPIQANVILALKKGESVEKIFPHRVREAMKQETEALFRHVLKEKLPAEELLSANYTFANQALAAFYGLPALKGTEMRKVPLPPETHRQGLLGHGSFLLVTSNPTRTSPVKRGLFVLENLLGAPTPPPPPNIPPLEGAKHNAKMSMRELMVAHRADPLCASCHRRMDPIGLALENFNALGIYRDQENGAPIDSAGQLVTGETFSSTRELIQILVTTRKNDFYRCLTEKLLTYALGRGLEASDIPHINRVMEAMRSQEGRLSALVLAVTESVPFQKTRAQSAVAKSAAPR